MKVGFVSAATAAIALGVAISANLSGAINRADTINNFPKVMVNFGISADDATESMNRLVAGVHGLPTSLNDITSLAEAFTPMTNNISNATTLALAFNDALLAGGTPMANQTAAMEQFRQALAKGMPQLQDWRSIEMAMPAQLQQIGKYLGLGAGQLKDYANNGQGLYQAMQDGKLSLNDFANALVTLDQRGNGVLPSFEQQAKNASTGIQTSITVMNQNIQQGMVDLFNSIGSQNIQQELRFVGSEFTNTFNVIATGINLIKSLGDWVGPVLNGVGTGVVVFGSLAAATYVAVKAFTAFRIVLAAVSGPLGLVYLALGAIAGVAAAVSFNNMSNSLGDAANSSNDINNSTAGFNANLQQAATNADDVSKQLAKINEQSQKARDDYQYSLAQLVEQKNEEIATLTKTLADEKKEYDDAYNERLASFNKSQNEELLTHTQKVRELQNQIDFLSKYNSQANQQQVAELKFALAQENAQYQQSTKAAQDQFDAQTQSARDSYQEQYEENKKKLDADLALLEQHRQDVLGVRNVMLLDEIDSLKKQRDAQLQSLQEQRQDIISQLASAGGDAGNAAGNAFSNNFTHVVSDLTQAAEDKIRKLVNYGRGVKSDVVQDNKGNYYVVPEFADGGFTGNGGKYDAAGIVHAGEYVVPREQVNQSTGLPKNGALGGAQNITVNLSLSGVMTSSKSDERAIATRIAKLINEAVKSKTGKAAIVGV